MADMSMDRFRAAVEQEFRFLEDHGFRRSRPNEGESPVGASVVYVGTHVGFRISYDVRDAQVDVRVVRARNGGLVEIGEGGYSRNLLLHLVDHSGYRGGAVARGSSPAGGDAMARMVGASAALLRTAGDALLADDARSLPEE